MTFQRPACDPESFHALLAPDRTLGAGDKRTDIPLEGMPFGGTYAMLERVEISFRRAALPRNGIVRRFYRQGWVIHVSAFLTLFRLRILLPLPRCWISWLRERATL